MDDYIDNYYSDKYKEIRFKQEALLDSDNFNQPLYREGLEALAQTIQNIIFIEPGTYPNQPFLGVGISKYLFEILDAQTISDINSEIENQISTFINYNNIRVTCNVNKVTDKKTTRYNTVSITVSLVNIVRGTSVTFNYLFAGNSKNRKVVSELIL